MLDANNCAGLLRSTWIDERACNVSWMILEYLPMAALTRNSYILRSIIEYI